MPGVQYPHWAAPSSAKACWSGCSRPPSAIPSTVMIRAPSVSTGSARHESTGAPSTSTVQVPHSPSSQPCLVPVSPRSSRSTSTRVLWTGTSASRDSPLTFRATRTFIRAPSARGDLSGLKASLKILNRASPCQVRNLGRRNRGRLRYTGPQRRETSERLRGTQTYEAGFRGAGLGYARRHAHALGHGAQILVGRDVVAPEHRAGATPADLHGNRLTHPSADHVSHAAPAQVVE